MSPRRSFELEGDSGDVGERLLGGQYRAWGDDQLKR